MLLHLITFTAPDDNTGYGVLSRHLFRALSNLQSENLRVILSVRHQSEQLEANIATCADYSGEVLNIIILVGPDSMLQRRLTGRTAYLTMFELDVLPDYWAPGLNLADLIFTPSAWGRRVMIDAGIDFRKIHVLPLGVDGNLYNPWGPRLAGLPAGAPFTFLVVGKYETRKGYEQLLQAFAEEFGDDSSVRLLIKADHFYHADRNTQVEAALMSRGLKNIGLIKGNFSETIMAQIYRSFDAFVYPSLGEGFGLPLLEAMACGLPVVATCVTGHAEYLSTVRGQFLEVETRLTPVPADAFQDSGAFGEDRGRWHVPLIESLRVGMREAVRKPGRADALAVDLITRYSWEAMAHRLVGAVKSQGGVVPPDLTTG